MLRKLFNKEVIRNTFLTYLDHISVKSDVVLLKLDGYIRQNGGVIIGLVLIALAAYGFELFNFILTMDEEKFAVMTIPRYVWIAEGRWGMYILGALLFPYPVIPTIPLFVALIFHIVAVLLILNAWQVTSKLEQVIAGAIMLTFPTLAYAYAFSTFNYGVGIGFFCVGLSLFLYSKNKGQYYALAVLPAVFALAIYQAFALALVAAYIVYLILVVREDERWIKSILNVALINFIAFVIYYFIQKLWQILGGIEIRDFMISKYTDFSSLHDDSVRVLSMLWSSVFGHYFGDSHIYGIEIKVLGFVLIISLIGVLIKLHNDKYPVQNNMLILLGTLVLLGAPFSFAFLSRGVVESRTLLALPISFAGFFLIGLLQKPRIVRISILLLALFCIFKFSVSTNRLFASSYLALQADRLVAVRLMDAIDVAKSELGILKPEYLEVVGILTPPQTQAIFRKTYPFGNSFFEFSFDNSRIAAFLQVSGYETLMPLSMPERINLVKTANLMPVWPLDGSVKIMERNIVLIKFGDYSDYQKMQICSALPSDNQATAKMLPEKFCP